MLVWLNGTFGVGKTTTARELVTRFENTRLFDPELVGSMLVQYLPDRWLGDFQDWTAWRSLVVATAAAVRNETQQDLLAVQTVLREDYWRELRDGLTEQGFEVFHVLLTADEPPLRARIEADDPEISQWRLDHLATARGAEPWMRDEADLVVDTTTRDAVAATEVILEALSRRL